MEPTMVILPVNLSDFSSAPASSLKLSSTGALPPVQPVIRVRARSRLRFMNVLTKVDAPLCSSRAALHYVAAVNKSERLRWLKGGMADAVAGYLSAALAISATAGAASAADEKASSIS